jgi:hypothetical protein
MLRLALLVAAVAVTTAAANRTYTREGVVSAATLLLPAGYAHYEVRGCDVGGIAVAGGGAISRASVTIHNSRVGGGGVRFEQLTAACLHLKNVTVVNGAVSVGAAAHSVVKLDKLFVTSADRGVAAVAVAELVNSTLSMSRLTVTAAGPALQLSHATASNVSVAGGAVTSEATAVVMDRFRGGTATFVDVRVTAAQDALAFTRARANASLALSGGVLTAGRYGVYLRDVIDSTVHLVEGAEVDGAVAALEKAAPYSGTTVSVAASCKIVGKCDNVDCAVAPPPTTTSAATPAPLVVNHKRQIATGIAVGISVAILVALAVAAVLKNRGRGAAPGAAAEFRRLVDGRGDSDADYGVQPPAGRAADSA